MDRVEELVQQVGHFLGSDELLKVDDFVIEELPSLPLALLQIDPWATAGP